MYFIVTPQQLWRSPRLGAIFSHQNPQHVAFPEHMADLRSRGREFMSSTFPGGRQDGKSTAWAVPDAEILRAIFCHHQTQKEGAGRGSRERRSEEAKRNGRAPAGGGSGWTRRQGPRHKGELTSGGGSSTSPGSRDARERSEPRAWVTALDLARARGPTKRRALFSLEERQGLKFFGPSAFRRKQLAGGGETRRGPRGQRGETDALLPSS